MQILVIIILILLNAFFAAAEIAFIMYYKLLTI